jgi:hypothetical protein
MSTDTHDGRRVGREAAAVDDDTCPFDGSVRTDLGDRGQRVLAL